MIKNKKNKDKNAHNKQEQQIMESVDDNKEGKYSIKVLFKIYFQKMIMRINKKKLKKLKFNKKKKRRKSKKSRTRTAPLKIGKMQIQTKLQIKSKLIKIKYRKM